MTFQAIVVEPGSSLDGKNIDAACDSIGRLLTAAPRSASFTWQVPVTATPASIAPAWLASTAYVLGQVVTNGGKLYRCSTAGTSASSGGPTGTATDITDNTAHWRYLQVGSAFKGGAMLRNLSTSASPIFVGDSTLAATNGHEIPAGQAEVDQAPDLAAVFVCTASGTATATVRAYT
jgi:hypothetical protein